MGYNKTDNDPGRGAGEGTSEAGRKGGRSKELCVISALETYKNI